jgi:hypothetical protein
MLHSQDMGELEFERLAGWNLSVPTSGNMCGNLPTDLNKLWGRRESRMKRSSSEAKR